VDDDGFCTNPGLNGEFTFFFSILVWVLVCMLGSIMFGG
jgi:hypothetical protein